MTAAGSNATCNSPSSPTCAAQGRRRPPWPRTTSASNTSTDEAHLAVVVVARLVGQPEAVEQLTRPLLGGAPVGPPQVAKPNGGAQDETVMGLDLLPLAAATPPSPDETALLGGTAVALAGCVLRPLWPTARLVVTAVHELGHAFTAILLGGRGKRVHLWLNTAGLTSYSLPGSTGRVRGAAVAVAGYPAPGIAGLLGAVAVVAGQARWWVGAGALVALALRVLWVRNPWGIWSTVIAAAGLGWLAWSGPPRLVTAVGAGLVVLLLVGGSGAGGGPPPAR